jgi:hypothetical protein
MILVLDEGEWSVLRSCRFSRKESAPSVYCTVGCVGLSAGLDTPDKRKISYPFRESNPNFMAVQSVAHRYTGCAIPAPMRQKHVSKWTKKTNKIGKREERKAKGES